MKATSVASIVFLILLTTCISPQAHAIGIIVPRIPDIDVPLLESATINAVIDNNIARTRITQVFRNNNSRPVEADYFFPVPNGADITDFVLYVNGKPVKGEVLDKDQAHYLYRDIVRRMKDPGLIEWKEKNLFRVRVFPIPAHGEQKLEIEISQQLTADQGYFRYHLPMKAGQHPESAEGQPDITYTINIQGDGPVRNVYSPTHKIDYSSSESKTVVVTAKDGEKTPPKNFSLFYESSSKDIAVSLLTQKSPGDEGYFSLRISPPWDESTTVAGTADYVFVIDSSGSMAEADKMIQAQKALRYCVGLLNENDRFNLVRFSTTVEPMLPELTSVTSASKAVAVNWISQLQPRGGTNISEALKTALKFRAANADTTTISSPLYTVVFITDGQPTVGETSPDTIAKSVLKQSEGNVRVFTFGVGHDVNTRLIDKVAESTRAASDYVAPDADLEVPISRFFDKVSRPAMYNLDLEIPGVSVTEVFPAKLPDLFYGTELAVFGRYKLAGPTVIKLTGTLAGLKKTFEFEKIFSGNASNNSFLEKLWATRKVAWLLDQIRMSGESKEVKEEVEQLAKKYGIVTPFTSYLAMEDQIAPASTDSTIPRPPPIPRSPYTPASGNLGFYSRAAEHKASVPAKESQFALKSESGAAAVNMARDLGRMRNVESLPTDQNTQVKQVHNKTFRYDNGVWKDASITAPPDKTLPIKYLSDAWFQIADISTEFRDYLALGDQVQIKLSNGQVLQIGPVGAESIDVNDLNALVSDTAQKN